MSALSTGYDVQDCVLSDLENVQELELPDSVPLPC